MSRVPSPSTVISLLALVVALGGTSYAAFKLPRNSVLSKHVKDGSLLAKDFKAGQLPAGATGPAGPKGDAGAPGASGPAGATGAEGAPATTKRTVLTKDTGTTVVSPPAVWTQLETIGTFTKDAGDTVVRVTWTGNALHTALYCHFQLRIDGAAENGSTATTLAGATGAVVTLTNTGGTSGAPFSSYSVWSGLAAGEHTVTVWLYGPGASTPNCQTNPGNNPGSTRVYVEEGR
jgi:hypothetical protein